MVTFYNVGRMGNFLFQAAAAMAYAWEHGLEFTVPSTTREAIDHPIYLQHLVHPDYDPILPWVKVKEKGHNYSPIGFSEYWRNRNIILDGYWQSEKYFKAHRERILDAFGFPWRHCRGWVSVHVRRGDYLTIQRGSMFKHPPVPVEWYARAMVQFLGFQFMFFSDDIEWCKQVFGCRSDCTFSHNNEEEDLVNMSNCEHHICSASTFSWWGMWLNQNPNKRVIFPQHWITPGWADLDMSDIVPEWCHKL